MGGLARKATIVDKVKSNGSSVFIADAGNLFFKTDKYQSEMLSDKAKVSADVILESFNKIGCDAITVGSKDFALGLDHLLGLQQKAEFPFLSANIKDKTGNLIFDPYTIVNKDGIDVGFIGLTSIFQHNDLQVDDPFTALDNVIEMVQDGSDIIVLLFHADKKDIGEFNKRDYPINLVLQSKITRRSRDGGTGKIPVFTCGSRGKYLYKFDFTVSEGDIPFIDTSKKTEAIREARRQIKSYERKIQRTPKNSKQYKQKIIEFETEIGLLETEINNAENKLEIEIIELDKHIVDRPDILQIVSTGKDKIEALGGSKNKRQEVKSNKKTKSAVPLLDQN
ncbi:MAG: bifunctional metallophosphatase/5'-nucleotidase [Candidatus Marinimicrobia bacterium]|nr:bifunctional metallophosphatase/5'-nucleotidase [Candidatus Neomarinimicrobiota bacterium]MBL7023222.1 bifunctional metallophosphatase/5'-nucleotidase [Candidatus Neomarinimicrobiota bacterium]